MYRVAYATCSPDPAYPPDTGAQHFAPIAARHGLDVIPKIWNDPAVNWQDFDMVLLRSTWDYYMRPGEFLAWLDDLPVPVWNPPELVRWNYHKKYLLELAANGFKVVPTHLIDRGSSADLASILRENDWQEAVIKPAIANSAFNTFRVDAQNLAFVQTQLTQSLPRMDMLIQPFVPHITSGEWSLIFFREALGDIRFSHAVLKLPAEGDMRVQAEFGGQTFAQKPPASLVHDAHKLLESVRYPWLYARVDGVAADERLLLMELELIEPEIFLEHHPTAADTFTQVLKGYLDA
jgi:glutathione synthase/RimK-type ligase-like ATP-grasp enzyme